MNFLKKTLTMVALAAVALGPVSGVVGPVAAEAASARQINSRSQTALTTFRNKYGQGSNVLSRAKGILVFPHLYKGAIIVGGRYGEGQLLVNDRVHSYYNLVGVSWGFQLGGQRQSLIITFMTDEALQKFINSDGWELGADATVAVIDAGTQGDVSTSRINKPVMAFVVNQKGLMAGVSLKGSKITRIKK
jgi:lipid-binding SYLF domain-containing protein